MSAAAFSTARAPPISSCASSPCCSSATSARLDASNSTGSVTSWNSTTALNRTRPIVVSPVAPRIRPRKTGKIQIDWPNVATGTSVWRIFIGKYPRASWIAWPASCAATPSAASDVAFPTSWDRFSVRLRGS